MSSTLEETKWESNLFHLVLMFCRERLRISNDHTCRSVHRQITVNGTRRYHPPTDQKHSLCSVLCLFSDIHSNQKHFESETQRREKIVTQNFKTTNLCESKPQESFIVCIHMRSLIRWWLNVAASQQNRENERHTQGDNLHIIAVQRKKSSCM